MNVTVLILVRVNLPGGNTVCITLTGPLPTQATARWQPPVVGVLYV